MSDYGVTLFGHGERAWSNKKRTQDSDFWGVDWSSNWLGSAPISSVVWSIPSESGLTTSDQHTNGNITSIKLSDGVVGDWLIDITITSDSRIRKETFILRVE